MSLGDVRERLSIVEGAQADALRARLIESIVDTTTDYYRDFIAGRQQCSDGMCYRGYLWDSLREPRRRVSMRFINENSHLNAARVYAMWDIHSRDRIFIPNYWKFPKEAILM